MSIHTESRPTADMASDEGHMTPPEDTTFAATAGMSTPPIVAGKYTQDRALEDLPAIKYAAALFLDSHMVESEKYCLKVDPKKERLYITSGYSLIQCLKSLMSYEDKDLMEALAHLKHGNALADKHRAPPASLPYRLAGLVWTSTNVEFVRAMTPVQRHAELLYAETTFAKALVGSVCSGSWLGFIKEALSFRTMVNVYLQLGKYVEVMDAEASARGEGPEDKSIDKDFRSGVELGVGASNLILSLMPGKLLSVAELFGYTGNRQLGLTLLAKAGGWSKDSKEPSVSIAQEGVRRSLADIALLVFHLVISSYTFNGVDIPLAQTILDWNLKRYPNGVFFLFGQGRLRMMRGKPALAIESYEKAMAVQSQYHNLHYISFWEIAVCNFALWDITASLEYWKKLEAEATWSKACYLYGKAVCLLQLGGAERIEEAARALDKIPSVVHKIAGKSIPIEKFVARKARKFQLQGKRLILPALEFSYMFLSIAHAPRMTIMSKMVPEVDRALAKLKPHESNPSSYEGGNGFWDDFCLARFLEGVCLRYIAYVDRDAVVDRTEDVGIPEAVASARALRAFELVLEHADDIELDHYLIYYTHYELGQLHVCMGNEAKAREHLDLVTSGKALEANPKARTGKYSMQSQLQIRAMAALDGLSASESSSRQD